MAMRTKIYRLLRSVTHKSASGNFSNNGPVRRNRFGPIGGFALFSSYSLDNSEVLASSRLVGWKGYEEYRRALYGGNITHKALLVDAVGTLVIPSQPMARVCSLVLLFSLQFLWLPICGFFPDLY